LLPSNALNRSEHPDIAADPCGSPRFNQVVLGFSLARMRKLADNHSSGDRAPVSDAAIVKRSVRIAGHPTSVSLEAAFWRGLCDIAASRRVSVNALLTTIDAARAGNLSSAIRLFVLDSARRGELS
jgi:predicted DNA-binding ribbon-helix-helix protein